MAAPESETVKPKPEATKSTAADGGNANKADATKYVGTPAVGTSKAAAAGGLGTVGPEPSAAHERRRRLVWRSVTAFLGAWFIAFLPFFLARTLFDPPTIFNTAAPSESSLRVGSRSPH